MNAVGKGHVGFGNPGISHIIDVQAARQRAAKVRELVHSCQFLSVHGHCSFLVLFPWSRLVHYLSLFGTDSKTKFGAGNGEQVHGVLHVFRTISIEGTIISKQEVTELIKMDLGLGLKVSQVEQLAIRSVSDVDAWVGVLEGICQHGCEHHAEQCWSQHAALFHSICHWEGSR